MGKTVRGIKPLLYLEARDILNNTLHEPYSEYISLGKHFSIQFISKKKM